jgi:tetratricopeptide (TPR) repeat protein
MRAAVACVVTAMVGAAGWYAWQSSGRVDAEAGYEQLLARDDRLSAADAAETSRLGAWRQRWREWRLDRAYRRFLRAHPQHARAMVAYGGFLYDRHRVDEALGWWKRVIALPDPEGANRGARAHAYNNIATHYGHNGRIADALRCYEEAFALEPAEPVFRFNWATTCVLYRRDVTRAYGWDTDEIFRRGLEQFRIARDLAPQDFSLASAYAETFYLQPKPDWHEAYAAWQFCLGQPLDDQSRQRVYAHLARVCMRLGRYEEAKRWLENIHTPPLQRLRGALERKLLQLSAGSDAEPAPQPPLPPPQ